ncbi:MAG TPA: hypothetical protein PKO33_13870 [Pyrinomonadaceae bacterium]|nr:hypothetical protein [Pyrinomonadaceae bacterium]
MIFIFKFLAVILAAVAAYLLLIGNKDWGFAIAVLAAVSFFLSIRFEVKGRLAERARKEKEELVAEDAE